MSEEHRAANHGKGERLFGLGMIVAAPGAIEVTSNAQRMEMALAACLR